MNKTLVYEANLNSKLNHHYNIIVGMDDGSKSDGKVAAFKFTL
jgi:hypothetical protein